MSRRHAVAVAAALLALAAGSAAADPPATGRYAAELCITLEPAAPNCGPADAQVLRGNRVLVRVADIVWQLQLHSSQADVVMLHGAMQIDGFVANYEWLAGPAIEFVDADKRTRYALRLAGPAR